MISIITINYNNAGGLEKTIKSVVGQTYDSIEYIVIDGGSSDNSVEVIKTYKENISYWISEKDKGIYHAMNKGIVAAKGEYLLFLNSGDYLSDSKVLTELFSNYTFEKDIVYGDLLLEDEKGRQSNKRYPDKLTFKFFYRNDSLPHPSSFIKRSLFNTVGFYNESLKIVSDWEFWLKAIFLYQATYAHVPVAISVFDVSGASSKPESQEIMLSEKEIVYNRYFSGFKEDYEKSEALFKHFRSNVFMKVLRRLIFSGYEL